MYLPVPVGLRTLPAGFCDVPLSAASWVASGSRSALRVRLDDVDLYASISGRWVQIGGREHLQRKAKGATVLVRTVPKGTSPGPAPFVITDMTPGREYPVSSPGSHIASLRLEARDNDTVVWVTYNDIASDPGVATVLVMTPVDHRVPSAFAPDSAVRVVAVSPAAAGHRYVEQLGAELRQRVYAQQLDRYSKLESSTRLAGKVVAGVAGQAVTGGVMAPALAAATGLQAVRDTFDALGRIDAQRRSGVDVDDLDIADAVVSGVQVAAGAVGAGELVKALLDLAEVGVAAGELAQRFDSAIDDRSVSDKHRRRASAAAARRAAEFERERLPDAVAAKQGEGAQGRMVKSLTTFPARVDGPVVVSVGASSYGSVEEAGVAFESLLAEHRDLLDDGSRRHLRALFGEARDSATPEAHALIRSPMYQANLVAACVRQDRATTPRKAPRLGTAAAAVAAFEESMRKAKTVEEVRFYDQQAARHRRDRAAENKKRRGGRRQHYASFAPLG